MPRARKPRLSARTMRLVSPIRTAFCPKKPRPRPDPWYRFSIPSRRVLPDGAWWASFGAMHARLQPVRRAAGLLWVNDTHSALNRTAVARVSEPRSVDEVIAAVRNAGRRGEPLAVSGARHAMGGQQFLGGCHLLD